MENLVENILRDVSEGLRVWVTRDGLPLSEDQIRERANNIVAALVINYTVERR